MNQCGVYVIRCEPTDQVYVGASVHVVKRIREHFYRLEKGVHRNRRLRAAYNKYGKESFSSKVILYCDPADLERYGKQIIEKLRPEFNIVNTEHTLKGMDDIFRKAKEEMKSYGRIIRELEKMQKRTHRL